MLLMGHFNNVRHEGQIIHHSSPHVIGFLRLFISNEVRNRKYRSVPLIHRCKKSPELVTLSFTN